MENNPTFTPGQYVRVRATIHEPWQVRIFHSWNERRHGSGAVPYARVMLRDGFQFDKDAATESFSMIEPWVPEVGQWVFYYLGTGVDNYTEWQVMKITPDWYSIPDVHPYIYGGAVAPLTLPPFVAVGDKY